MRSMSFKLVPKKFSGAAVLSVALCLVFILSPVRLAAQAKDQVDPFYDKLLEAGKYFFQQGNYEGAVENIGIAFFGYLDHPEKLLECYVYLEVCQFLLKNTEKSKFYDDEIKRLNLRSNLDALKLPSGLRDGFLEINAYFSRLGGKVAGDTASGQVTRLISAGPPPAGAQPLPQRQPTPPPSSTSDPSAEVDQKIKNLKAVIKSSTTGQDAYFRLSAVYLDQKKYKDARRVLEDLLSVDPKNGRAYFEIGAIFSLENKPLDAVAAYAKALPLLPDDIELNYALAVIFYGQNDLDKARAAFGKVRQVNPDYKETAKYWSALSERVAAKLKESQDFLVKARNEPNQDKKIGHYQRALQSDPSNVEAAFELKDIWGSRKKYGDAANILETFLKYSPENLRTYKELGEVYIAEKAYLKAVAALTRGLKYDPVAVELRFLLGTAYMGAKKYAEAGDEFDIVLAGDPKYKNARALRQTCQEKLKK